MAGGDTMKKTTRKASKKPEPLLLNWPPSRGPKPKWLSTPPRYVVEEPTIECIEAEQYTPPEVVKVRIKAPPRSKTSFGIGKEIFAKDLEQKANAQVTWNAHVSAPIETLLGVTIEQARDLVHGIDRKLHRGKPQWASPMPVREFVCDLDYPLHRIARVRIRPYVVRYRRRSGGWATSSARMDLGYVLWQLARAYAKIYKRHKEFGIWGHAISDLTFESVDIKHNVLTVGVGS